MSETDAIPVNIVPILLYDGGCKVCSRIGRWVSASAKGELGPPSIIARPVGDDPVALRKLNSNLDIWTAYAVVHVLMPDGSMKTGGEAIAEVLRRVPATKWLTKCLSVDLLGVRPFQVALNLAYTVLDDVRPLLGCESCGRSRPWVRPFEQLAVWAQSLRRPASTSKPRLHFAPLAAGRPAESLPVAK